MPNKTEKITVSPELLQRANQVREYVAATNAVVKELIERNVEVQFYFNGQKLDCVLISTPQRNFKSEFESLAKALATAKKALEGIRDMPDYDQDNEHRLRNIARQALEDISDGQDGDQQTFAHLRREVLARAG